MAGSSRVSFESTIEEPKRGWPASLPVPEEVVTRFVVDGRPARVVCTLGAARFSCAIVTNGAARFIHLSKRLRDEAGVEIGDRVRVTLVRDTSPTGVELPAELAAVLEQEPDGARRFAALTPGRQRGIATLVTRLKSSERRIAKALAILAALQRGTTDLRELARARLGELEPPVERIPSKRLR
jgi:hypothetical protein